ncbi:MAG: carboxypeptidase M32 [Planctomycetes bacterium]|jgi:carboxypeptidase Taq|nr:carboxypeptidase M32 [Planctomycetota bacterium]MBT5120884.1 carboxypeptidase M32 [Planctomycetota bacterium]MBT7013299.1 carboxypeptidase M32 [Planctomycetota bacterium]MBT7317750.1 carboxypeptidase M32 [Planctomycetota bacterium]
MLPLLNLWAEIKDLAAASALLEWDQETYMPKGGQTGRGKVLATLAGFQHDKLSSTALRDALDTADDSLLDCAEAHEAEVLRAQIREARKEIDRAIKVPKELTVALAEAQSRGLAAWQKARAESDFSLFETDLAELVRLNQEKAAALNPGGRPYDALLDLYEAGSTEATLRPLFDELRGVLAPMIRAVKESGHVIDESPAIGDFPEKAQRAFGLEVAQKMGFDFDSGRLDLTTHPFCTSFNHKDVRITWRYMQDDFRSALYGIMHEAGHGLYEQGLPSRFERTPLGEAVGLGMHESQSRLWENLVGRSRAFWEWCLPVFKKHFPDKAHITLDQLYPTLHTCKPSLIRVEADEATYNLHVAARFEIERRLFAGEIEVRDLPAVWDDTYEQLLGVKANSVSDGVLQDIHWAMGAFGYFPTYTQGNLISSQLWEAMQNDIGDLDSLMRVGDLAPMRGWLGEKIHSQGKLYSGSELVERATGKALTAEPFIDSITSVTAGIYGL